MLRCSIRLPLVRHARARLQLGQLPQPRRLGGLSRMLEFSQSDRLGSPHGNLQYQHKALYSPVQSFRVI